MEVISIPKEEVLSADDLKKCVELNQRFETNNIISLLWLPEEDRAFVTVRNTTTKKIHIIHTTPNNAQDVYLHPFVYMSSDAQKELATEDAGKPVIG
jgi:hypothetical protein